MATLKDVAQKAGVSAQTVSNVVRGQASVSEKTRERVVAALQALQYRPNLAARGLRRATREAIAFVVVDPSPRYLADPFHADVVAGLADVAREHASGLLIQNVPPDSFGEALADTFAMADGAVVTLGGPQLPSTHRALARSPKPFVLLEHPLTARNGATVRGANRAGARAAAHHLVGLGHTRFAFVKPRLSWPAVDERLAGFREALARRHHLQVVETTLESPDAAFEAVRPILTRRSKPTALMGGNDLLAIGILQAAQDVGHEVPSDIAVMGFDDFAFASYVRPRLSTVRLPAYEMGRCAANLLFERIATGSFSEREIIVPTELVLRESA